MVQPEKLVQEDSQKTRTILLNSAKPYASELFENQNVRSDQVTKLIEKKSAILAKATLTKKDKSDLEKIDGQIGDLPTGRDSTEIEAMELIKKAALYLKENDKDR